MYLDYFNKFKNMDPYLYIGPDEWSLIKQKFDRPDIQETLVEILKDYENTKYKKMVDSAYDKLVNNLNIDVFYEKYIVPLAEKGKTK